VIVRHYVLGTAGHIDHGKSALVKALTGTDPDRLPEEKSRGITIDLGFAEVSLTAGDGSPIHAGIVDVPGHEGFVRNMIAGVGSIDLALLVVAADDGWMPQTEEHLQILTYLGVERAVVAITKADLGGADEIARQARAKLEGTPFSAAPLIPVSTRTGAGLSDLRNALASQLSECKPNRDIGKPRLFVDRAFSLPGIGTVVTGTLSGGQLQKNDEIVVEPGDRRARIRSLQNHGCAIEIAEPGMRAAANLPGLTIDSSADGAQRGNVITNEAFGTSRTLDVLLERSARPLATNRPEPAIATGSSVYLHHGTSRIEAKLVLLESARLAAGQQAVAQLRLASPVLAFQGDRFVIRDASERRTLAGGIVLDPAAKRDAFRGAAQRELLTARAAAPNDVAVAIKTELARHGAAQSLTLLRKSRFAAAEIAASLEHLRQTGSVILVGELATDSQTWKSLIKRAVELVDQRHKISAEKAGIELDNLRAALNQPAMVFDALISELTNGDFIKTGNLLARRTHRAELPAHLIPAAERIRAKLSATPFDPPSRKELIREDGAQQALAFLITQDDIIDTGNDLLLSLKAFSEMKAAIATFISKNGPATVSQIRMALNTSRRVALPLLELLDRQGFTQRVGDHRQLGKGASDGIDQHGKIR
jgi:selenocysteine-specific elongation factor